VRFCLRACTQAGGYLAFAVSANLTERLQAGHKLCLLRGQQRFVRVRSVAHLNCI